MKQCPVCGHMEYEGALFCSECGAPLFRQPPEPAGRRFPKEQASPETPAEEISHPAAGKIVLVVEETGNKIILNGASRREWILGRTAPGQTIVPDIDLTPYEAYDNGVSRLHAAIRISEDGKATITDLGSSNGTRLNGLKIPPNIPQPLSEGDRVLLGKLALRVHLNSHSEDSA